MKTTNNYATYQSPVSELLSVEFEGTVLAQSPTTNSASYTPFIQAEGTDLNF